MKFTRNFKYCPKCRRTKNVGEFYKSKTKDDGLQSYCRVCLNKMIELTGRKRNIITIFRFGLGKYELYLKRRNV